MYIYIYVYIMLDTHKDTDRCTSNCFHCGPAPKPQAIRSVLRVSVAFRLTDVFLRGTFQAVNIKY